MGNTCITPKNIDFFYYKKRKKNYSILDWKSNHKIYNYHWWPYLEKRKNDNNNNLFANNGGLQKYDKLFNTNSIEYQKQKYYIDPSSKRKDKSWAGFCDKAAMLSCLYEYPKYNVSVKYYNNEIKFSVNDIEMLMIIAAENSIKRGSFLILGKRNNDFQDDDKNEPYPLDLLNMLKIISNENEPFVIDIDNGFSVWNYSFDQIQVLISDKCPVGHNLIKYNYVDYLNFSIKSSAYPNKNINIWGYVAYNTLDDFKNKINIKQGWINNKHPDFLWKVYPNNMVWQGKCIINPEISAETVYKIYKHSLNEKNKNKTLDLTDVIFI